MNILSYSIFAACLISNAALAQSPAISTGWMNMTNSQNGCLARAEQALRQHGFNRIERIDRIASVFGDTKDDRSQVVIRCAAAKQFVFFAMAGPSEPELTKLIDMLKDTFGKF